MKFFLHVCILSLSLQVRLVSSLSWTISPLWANTQTELCYQSPTLVPTFNILFSHFSLTSWGFSFWDPCDGNRIFLWALVKHGCRAISLNSEQQQNKMIIKTYWGSSRPPLCWCPVPDRQATALPPWNLSDLLKMKTQKSWYFCQL